MSDNVYSSDQVLEILLSAARNRPRQLQQMIDAVSAMQGIMPMPADGWGQFKRDIKHTNEKHGLNLTI